MTDRVIICRQKNKEYSYGAVICIAIALLMIIMSDEMRRGIYQGLVFSFTTIIPTLFPFFILSDVWGSAFKLNSLSPMSRLFERCFGISGCGLSALISGIICGFPIGVKIAVGLYDERRISKDELQRLVGFVNNPSVAFVISGVGGGILGSLRDGALLYFSLIASALTVGFIFRKKEKITNKTDDNSGQSFDISKSIVSAGVSSMAVASCITAFSGLLALLSALIKNELALSLLSPLLEVSNATKMLGDSVAIPYGIRLLLIGFSLGFSGLSVHLQAFSFFRGELSKSRYLLMKLIQGMICSLLSCFLSLIFK